MDSKQYRDLMKTVGFQIQQEAQTTRASFIGKVIAIKSGRKYDIETQDGKIYRDVASGALAWKYSFKVDDWLCVEDTGADWQVLGLSNQAGS